MHSEDDDQLSLQDLEIYIPEDVQIQSVSEVTCIWPVVVQKKGATSSSHSPEVISTLLLQELEPSISFVSSNLAAFKEIKGISLAQVRPSGGPPPPPLHKDFKPPTQQDCVIIYHQKIYLMIRKEKNTSSALKDLDSTVHPGSAPDKKEGVCIKDESETNRTSTNRDFSPKLNGLNETREASTSTDDLSSLVKVKTQQQS